MIIKYCVLAYYMYESNEKLKSIFIVLIMLTLSYTSVIPSFEEKNEELGDIIDVSNTIPVSISELNSGGFQSGSMFGGQTLALGAGHTCVIIDNGSVSCWGKNSAGQLGDGATWPHFNDSDLPITTLSLGVGRTATSISAGNLHTCAILDNGSVSCWGRNNVGQLGDGTNVDRSTPGLTLSLGVGRTAVTISAGVDNTCVILDDGLAKCWGGNSNGQLGDGTSTDRNIPTAVSIPEPYKLLAISVGFGACGLVDNGSVVCWGPDGLGNNNYSPVQISSFGLAKTAVAISKGGGFSCALLNDGSVSCWGNNVNGQLGDGTITSRSTPAPTSTLGSDRHAISISSSDGHACVLLDDYSIKCWGYNPYGALGDGTTTSRNVPTSVSTLNSTYNAISISTSQGGKHSCAILADGTVNCWGRNYHGQLGDGTNTRRLSPVTTLIDYNNQYVQVFENDFDNDGIYNIFEPIRNSNTLSAGYQSSCAIISDGSVNCWGMNTNGQLGDGTTTNRSVATPVLGLDNGAVWVEVSEGNHACAILDNGSVYCWGQNSAGQLGDGSFVERLTPVQVNGLGDERATKLALGQYHSCALMERGEVRCWGGNSQGQLGDGTTFGRPSASATSSLSTNNDNAVSIVAGEQHTCALLQDGGVSCWGWNYGGQLGIGSEISQSSPQETTLTSNGSSAISLAAGSYHTCAILQDGNVHCWGLNSNGALGDGTIVDRNASQVSLTVDLGSGRTATKISAGMAHTCAHLDNDTVSCWGWNDDSQIGDGTTIDRLNPVNIYTGYFRTVRDISVGWTHTCALLDNGGIKCWGDDSAGQIGIGSTSGVDVSSPEYTSIKSTRTIESMGLGQSHTCFLLDTNELKCWGTNGEGQLGNGTSSSTVQYSSAINPNLPESAIPISVTAGPRDVGNIQSYGNTCVLTSNDGVYCWGSYLVEYDGNGNSHTTPTKIPQSDDFVELVQASHTACAINKSSAVFCWGRNIDYLLNSNNRSNDSYTPVLIEIDNSTMYASNIYAGGRGICAKLLNSSVVCWGANSHSNLGVSTSQNSGFQDTHLPSPTLIQGFGSHSEISDMALGGGHSCILFENGSVTCFGTNEWNQMGVPTTGQSSVNSPLNHSSPIKSIQAGGSHTCAIDENDTMLCWGRRGHGELGDGVTSHTSYPGFGTRPWSDSTLTHPHIGKVSQIALGQAHTCAVIAGDSALVNNQGNTVSYNDSAAYCWGYGGSGNLGNNATSNVATPVSVSILNLDSGPSATISPDSDYDGIPNWLDEFADDPMRSVSCLPGTYGRHDCLVTPVGKYSSDSAVYATDCSPGNYSDELGLSDCKDASAGYYVDSISAISQLPCPTGTYQSLEGQISCTVSSPGYYSEGTVIFHVDAVTAGDGQTCILSFNDIYCWGENPLTPDLTYINNGIDSIEPLFSSLGSSVTKFSTGQGFGCAIIENGSVACWGGNSFGQLGDGTTNNSITPVFTESFGSGRTAVEISAGSTHACALLDDGNVSCWGRNTNGRLGDGTYTDRDTPTLTEPLPNNSSAVAISAGGGHTCAILDNGSVSCWGGGGQGQMGNGASGGFNNLPVMTEPLPNNRSAVEISAGVSHTCALLDNGNVSCWGYNYEGQLGDGSNSNSLIPILTNSFPRNLKAVSISGKYSRHCALLEDGSTSCWGDNDYGQLGDGTTTDSNVPVQTGDFGFGRTATAISVGNLHTCAILDDKGLSCWGINDNGVLGTSDSYVPQLISNLAINATGQIACSPGQYQPSSGQNSCLNASAGYFVPDSASTTQTICPIGSYQSNEGQSSCLNSQPGYYVSSAGQTSQIPCDVGTFQPYSGASFCYNSSAGYFVNTNGSSSQTPCYSGTYQPNTGQSSCLDADAGYYVDTSGSTSQSICVIGTYQPNTGQSSCLDADAGYYVDSSGATSQTACLLGTYNPNTGSMNSSACLDADAGNYVDTNGSASQSPCNLGTYHPNTGQSSCLDADTGYYVGTNGSTSQTPCNTGTYQPNISQSSCLDADAGHYVDTNGSASQTPCNLGTYNPNTGSTNSSACLDADAGYYVDTNGSASQTPCNLGTYQPNTGQSFCFSAEAGYYIATNGSSSPTPCDLGTYQPYTGQSSCLETDPGYYTDVLASISQIACSVGSYQPLSAQSSCLDSDAGYYVDSNASVTQIPCSLGTYQPNTGQSSCLDADAGYYVDNNGSASQTPCSLGTYQPNVGQPYCIDADAGHFVNTSASTSQIACNLGTYQPSTGQPTCIKASTGYYVNTTASTSQMPCSVGTYQPSIGQTICIMASSGHYVDTNGSASQTPCNFGTYQPNTGQSSCLDANPGHFVNIIGSSNETECDLGSYQNLSGQSFCLDASIGFYVDQQGSINQTSCPTGTSTNTTGSISINDCYTDTDFDGIPDIIDPDDDNDGYLDDLDAFPLDPNEWIDTDGDGIGNNVDTDDDNDGWSDLTEIDCGDSDPLNETSTPADFDNDNICDNLDSDDDNDTYDDSNDDFPFDECAVLDTDMDGMPDWIFLNCNTNLSEDIDDDNDGYNDTNDSHPQDSTEWLDTDNDGIGNNADTDDDGDNVPDQFDVFPLDSTEWLDSDGDGVGDNADTDDDNDGVPDLSDDFPNDANETTDTDGDGIGNNADDDDDGDGYLDIYDQFPLDSTEWFDTDLDGIGNNADPDDDGDGWTDNDEFICGSDELDANDVPDDSDGDGICDSEEDDNTGLGVIVDVLSNPLVVGLFLLIGAIIIVTLFLQSRNQSSRINELEGMVVDSTIIEDEEL
ncbi:hypothetical protein OAH71_02415 [Euryarchaeota archaeon]|nr:hypothetical protein [Euryarchaeota archaeon]